LPTLGPDFADFTKISRFFAQKPSILCDSSLKLAEWL